MSRRAVARRVLRAAQERPPKQLPQPFGQRLIHDEQLRLALAQSDFADANDTLTPIDQARCADHAASARIEAHQPRYVELLSLVAGNAQQRGDAFAVAGPSQPQMHAGAAWKWMRVGQSWASFACRGHFLQGSSFILSPR
jgi:hypothetical protein